jgi:hypothetical protein
MKISRSFSRKLNLGNYETLDVYCEAEAEAAETEAPQVSAKLSVFVEEQVMKDIERLDNARRMCVKCGGITIHGGKPLDKEGHCVNCASQHGYDIRDNKASADKLRGEKGNKPTDK